MGAGALAASRAAERRARLARVSETQTSSANIEGFEAIRSRQELSQERAKQNAFLKALRLGKFGQRSLLSGSFAGITNESAAASALGGTRPGASVVGASVVGAPAVTARPVVSGGTRRGGRKGLLDVDI